PWLRFNIDVKSDDAVDPTVEAILSAGALDRVLVTSFSERRRTAATRQLPGVATSASAPLVARSFAAAAIGSSRGTRLALRGVPAAQVPERYGRVRIVTARTVRTFTAAGVEVHVWTVNDADTMVRLLGLGVHGLVTDRADIAIDVIASRRRKHI
ncbi:glycerophosphodiester phosphodiesterase family protein, partial [Marisediminicola senii]|uniref:glycerophosphodiester phosphodiesterase family protein n=1 Tax=Marisediminicola senii TaxID=2711233 RepID=UPI0022A7B1DC